MRRGIRPVRAGASNRRPRGRGRTEGQSPPDPGHADGCLRDFDLGLVPASVTPPKSSRYAAWFAIATSVLAFGGLVTTATLLVGQPPDSAVADAPQFPRGNFGTSSSRPDEPPSALRGSGDAGSLESDTSALALPLHGRTGADAPRSEDSAVGEESTGAQGPTSASSGTASSPGSHPEHLAAPEHAPQPTPASNRPGEADRLQPLSVLPSLVERTEAYFAHLCTGESRAAFELTAGELRERGYSAFVEQHPVTSCEITAVESARSTAFATLRVTRPDGGTETQRRELSFSAASPPGITSDAPVP